MKRLLLVMVVVPFALLRFAAGCAAQGEGQLCNILNNTSDDCASGLVCTPKFGQDLGACCPPPPSVSTQPACVQNGNTSTGTGTGGSSTTTSSSTSSSTTSSSTSTSSSTTTTTTGTGGAGTGGSSSMLDGGSGG